VCAILRSCPQPSTSLQHRASHIAQNPPFRDSLPQSHRETLICRDTSIIPSHRALFEYTSSIRYFIPTRFNTISSNVQLYLRPATNFPQSLAILVSVASKSQICILSFSLPLAPSRFESGERQNSSHQKSTFSGVQQDGVIFHFGLVSVQLHLGMVGSGREKKEIDFTSTLRVRGLLTEARIPHVRYYGVSHIVSSLSGRSLCFPTCGWRDFCCIIYCYLWSERTGHKRAHSGLEPGLSEADLATRRYRYP
jgi:hypothetical protein